MSTVLVVDDSATEMEIMVAYVKGGLTVITANDGTDAMTKISNQKPDVIILDVVLPGRSSLNCVAILKLKQKRNSSRDVLNQRK